MGVIKFLAPEEARKIAAGEVIDRPAALVREFIDNALDSGAKLVEASIEDGGCGRVEVSDDGCGMDRDDLKIACGTHATSKISSLDDLSVSRSLGFRGEALAAAAAVSRLEILTSQKPGEGFLLTTGPSGETRIEPGLRTPGTSVRASGLFDTIPARKRFLKRPGSEALLCRTVFLDKAAAFPERAFRFVQDGKIRIFLPPQASYKDRFAAALLENNSEPAFLYEINAIGDGFSVAIVIGGPEISRKDRRGIYIFANGRRVDDFSLVQAVEYGTQGAFPNGCHPTGAVFISIEPHLADFNIHPAKREVKFSNHSDIHHSVSSSLRVFFHKLLVSKAGNTASARPVQEFSEEFYDGPPHDSSFAAPSAPVIKGRAEIAPPSEEGSEKKARYIGSAFNLFLLVEKDGRLYAIDQHAAHERILYDKLLSKPILKQELLVPIPFTAENGGDDEFLSAHCGTFERLGVVLRRDGGGWRIDALPALWRAGDAETVKALLDLKNSGENIAERWAATVVCHGALRDGDIPDDEDAARLAEEVFKLPVKCCPHGRPILAEINKDDLLRAVRRL